MMSLTSKSLPFIKMHGLGNDFIFIKQTDFRTSNFAGFIKKICNRKIGIGCDQLIVYHFDDKKKLNMKIYNSDGSKAQACGNATRCLVRLAVDKYGLQEVFISVEDRFLHGTVETEPDQISSQFSSSFPTFQKSINVNMGLVSFVHNWMPDKKRLSTALRAYNFHNNQSLLVDVANPHLVIFLEPNQSPLSTEQCKQLQDHKISSFVSLFKNSINISFVRVVNSALIELTVFERGVGFTLACGSAAVASFSAAYFYKLVGNSAEVKFEIGSLVMNRCPQTGGVVMSGPAEYVFEGSYYF